MTVHVIGAGLAGLSAATALASVGVPVTVSEAAPQAGGRCRSYADAATGLTIDNGNHLLLTGNDAALEYLARIGALDRMRGLGRAAFTFVDLRDPAGGFTVAPNAGRLPWWLLSRARRVPGTTVRDYLRLARLLRPPAGATVADVVPTTGPLWERLLEPLLLAALNTPPATASAKLAGAVLRGSLARGGRACRPLIAEPTLSAAFVAPALAYLAAQHATIRHRRLTGFYEGWVPHHTIDDSGVQQTMRLHVKQLSFGDETVAIGDRDAVILAVPATAAAALVAGLTVPTAFEPIVSLHFALAPPPGTPPILGVLGGTSEWIFAFADRISVTISGAEQIVDRDRGELAATVWDEVRRAVGLTADLPRWQVVKERRATFAATVAQDARRPRAATSTVNLFLAGDWTQTGLPATIEGSVQSGQTAARLALRHIRL